MTRPLKLGQEYIAKADELLADGQWHDGLAWMVEVEKEIAPGVAQRRQEAIRQRASSSGERIRQLSIETQIALGKRSIVQAFVHNRVPLGSYEVDPWPVPEGGWKTGGWKIRRPVQEKITIKQARARFGLHYRTLWALIDQQPALRLDVAGRTTYLYNTELEELGRRVEAYNATSKERKQAAYRRTFLASHADADGLISGELAQRGGISPRTVRMLRLENPDLGWIDGGGRIILLPIEKLDEWDQIVEEFKRGNTERRRQAALRSRAQQHGASGTAHEAKDDDDQ